MSLDLGSRCLQCRSGLRVNARIVDIDDQQFMSMQPVGQPVGGDRRDGRGIAVA